MLDDRKLSILTIATGSDGNCHVLEYGKEKLLLDCGVSERALKVGLNWNLEGLVGAVITHKHADHSKGVEFLRKSGINVYTPYELGLTKQTGFSYGSFRILCLPIRNDGQWLHTNGDGTECPIYCYVVTVGDNRILYATDFSYLPFKFAGAGITGMVIACNNMGDDIDGSDSKARHTITGHSTLETVKGIVAANLSEQLHSIVLCHLSATNADEHEMWRQIQTVAKESLVYVASPGQRYEIERLPFA